MRETKRFIVLAMALATALAFVPAASAHQSPEGCVGSAPAVSFATETVDQLDSPLREGDEIVFAVNISNQGESACDLSGVAVQVHLPDANGKAGEDFPVVSNVSLAAGYSVKATSQTPWVVGLDEGVFSGNLKITWQATSHNGQDENRIEGAGSSSVDFSITRPQSSLTVVPTVNSGEPPLEVKYVYALANTSLAPSVGLGAPRLLPAGGAGRQVLSDSNCDQVAYLSGDDQTQPETSLDPGETWYFTCNRIFTGPGTYLSQPSVNGTSSADGRSWPQVAAGGTTVTVLGPDLVVDKSHEGDLLAGTPGNYRLKVTNNGNQATSGTVTVVDQLPEGLKIKSIHGEGWTCSTSSLSCSRSDSLASGSSFPEVTVKVNTTASPPASVINTASVSGGGEAPAASANNSDSDPTTIKIPGLPDPTPENGFLIRALVPADDGSVKIKLKFPGNGMVTVDDASSRVNRIIKAVRPIPGKGFYAVTAKPTARFLAQMNRSKRPTVTSLRISFTPTNGLTNSKVRSVSLRVR